MTTPTRNYSTHTLVAFGGRLGVTVGTQDAWQCGVRIRNVGGAVPSSANLVDPAAYMNAIAAPLMSWFTQAKSSTAGSERMGMRSDAYLDWLKVNNINSLGHYANPTVNRYDYTGTRQGTVAADVPWFLSAVISFTTAKSRGLAHRGRIYLPLGMAGNNTTPQLSSLEQTECIGTGKALLSLLAAPQDGGAAVKPCVVSSKSPTLNDITGVAVGNIYAVQRRRKEQLPVTFATSVWP